MLYSELTQEQKASIDALASLMRSGSIALARLLDQFRTMSQYWSGNIENMVGGLDAGQIIPNASNLAGAQDLTKEEFTNLIGYFIVLSNTADGSSGSLNTNYHRALFAKAAGPANVAINVG